MQITVFSVAVTHKVYPPPHPTPETVTKERHDVMQHESADICMKAYSMKASWWFLACPAKSPAGQTYCLVVVASTEPLLWQPLPPPFLQIYHLALTTESLSIHYLSFEFREAGAAMSPSPSQVQRCPQASGSGSKVQLIIPVSVRYALQIMVRAPINHRTL